MKDKIYQNLMNTIIMKRILGIILIFVLPATAMLFVALIIGKPTEEIIGKNFPYIPEKMKGKKWMALVVKADCPHCITLLSNFSNTYIKTSFPIVAFSISEKKTTDRFTNKYSLPFHILQDEYKIAKELNIKRVPHTFFVDGFGKINHTIIGNPEKRRLERTVKSFFTTGKIPIEELSAAVSKSKIKTPFGQFHVSLEDTSLSYIFEQFQQNNDTAVGYFSIKHKNANETISQYFGYWNSCGCENDSTGFSYFSMILDDQTSEVLDKRFVENLSFEEINTYKKEFLSDFYDVSY